MTEQEWLESADATWMLRFYQGELSERKQRLFALACLRRIEHLLPGNDCQRLVETLERYIDGDADADELTAVTDVLYRASMSAGPPGSANAALDAALCAGLNQPDCVSSNAAHAASGVDAANPDWVAASNAEEAAQAELLRDIVGNPFHPVTLERYWLTPKVTALARSIYDGSRFQDLPVLADALEEPGCDNEDILGHCRNGKVHVRGCWVLDQILGKV